MEEKTKTKINIFKYALAAGLLGLTGLGIATLVITSNASKPKETKGIADKKDATGTTALTNYDLLFLKAYDYGMGLKATNDELTDYDDALNFSLDKDQNFESLINDDEHSHTVANEVILSNANDNLLSFMRLANDGTKYVKITGASDIVANDKLLAKLILNGKNTPYKQALVGTKGLFNSWFKSEAKNFPSKTWNNEILHGFSEILPKLKQQTKVVYGLQLDTDPLKDTSPNNNEYSAIIVDFGTKERLLQYIRGGNRAPTETLEFNIVFNGDQAPEMVTDISKTAITNFTLNSPILDTAHVFDDAVLTTSTNNGYIKTTITTVAIDKSSTVDEKKFAIMNWDKKVDKIYSHSIIFTKITNHVRAMEADSSAELTALKAAIDDTKIKKFDYKFYFNATKQEVFVSVNAVADAVDDTLISAPEVVKRIIVNKVGVIKN